MKVLIFCTFSNFPRVLHERVILLWFFFVSFTIFITQGMPLRALKEKKWTLYFNYAMIDWEQRSVLRKERYVNWRFYFNKLKGYGIILEYLFPCRGSKYVLGQNGYLVTKIAKNKSCFSERIKLCNCTKQNYKTRCKLRTVLKHLERDLC